ncbi:MAG: molybdopterin dinucleotide binding domain-containing protein, partial [Actinomycetota bacterium]
VLPDVKAQLWLNTYNPTGPAVTAAGVTRYATLWRKYKPLKDKYTVAGVELVGTDAFRFPKHWEPWETPREADLVPVYGKTGIAPLQTPGLVGTYPLVLTTFRVTEHFQAGQTTRNSPWLCELVPSPVIEINSADAYSHGINNGDPVYIDTVRGNNIGPFVAVVGTGIGATQRVKKGIVAVPWHWGNKGISTGPSANSCCIDSLDANTTMPESKVCLCRIHE